MKQEFDTADFVAYAALAVGFCSAAAGLLWWQWDVPFAKGLAGCLAATLVIAAGRAA